MKLNYELGREEYLTYQLYNSSTSETHQRRRNRIRVLIPVLYGAYGVYLLLKADTKIGGIAFLAMALVWFVFYPKYAKWRYGKHFEKHVDANYKNKFNRPLELELKENSIEVKDGGTESKMQASELDSLIELKNIYLLKLKTNTVLLIPKNAVSDKQDFKEKITNLNIDYLDETSWVWA